MKYSPYSYSKQDSYYSCPNKFKLSYIDKIRIPSTNNALEKGSYVHLVLEEDLKYDNPWLPDFEFKLHNEEEQKDLQDLVKGILSTEYQKKLKTLSKKSDEFYLEEGFGFDFEWNPTSYDYTYSKNVIQGFIDLYMVKGTNALVLDHKTGKYKDMRWQSNEQVMLYSLWIFKKYPEVKTVKCIYNYVEHDKRNAFTFTREEMDYIQKKFTDKLQKIESDKKFKKNPTKLCLWCDYFKAGHCVLTPEEEMKII